MEQPPPRPSLAERLTWILDNRDVGNARQWAERAKLSPNYVNTLRSRLRDGGVVTLKPEQGAALARVAGVPVEWMLFGTTTAHPALADSVAREQAILLLGASIHPNAVAALRLDPVPSPDQSIREWQARARELHALVDPEHGSSTKPPASTVRESHRGSRR